MSDEAKNKVFEFLHENWVVAIFGVIITALSWGNRTQLEEISLKQDKAILQVQADASEKYVTKSWFQQESSNINQRETQNAIAIQGVANTVADIKTSIAVLTSQMQQHNPTQKAQ